MTEQILVPALKEKIVAAVGVPLEPQRLIYKGKVQHSKASLIKLDKIYAAQGEKESSGENKEVVEPSAKKNTKKKS